MLKRKVEIIVPTTIRNISAPADLINQQVEHALRSFAAVAGGATAVEGEGAWLDTKGNLVRESVYNVYAYCTQTQFAWLTKAAYRVAEDIKRAMKQDSVAVVIDGVMKFIEND